MTLVDTSVWIDFLAGHVTDQVAVLTSLIEEGEDIATCGIILTEVLQGIRNDADHRKTRDRLEALVYLETTRSTYLSAADLYRTLRARGTTIRKSVDCLIAAVAIESNARLLHSDRDFHPLVTHCGLESWS